MLGGSLKPICDFVHDYADAVSDTDDRLMVVYPKVWTLLNIKFKYTADSNMAIR